MTEDNNPTEFYEPATNQWQVEHMTEDFEVWNTLEKFDNPTDAEDYADNYARGNPDVEVRIVKVREANY